MVYAFTETERRTIETKGYMVIEFKRFLYKKQEWINRMFDSIKQLADALLEFANKVVEAAVNAFRKLTSSLRNTPGYDFPTGRRYLMSKALKKCLNINTRRAWVMTRPAYLPRSNC